MLADGSHNSCRAGRGTPVAPPGHAVLPVRTATSAAAMLGKLNNAPLLGSTCTCSYGLALRDQGEHQAAVGALSRLLAAAPRDEGTLSARGFCLRKLGAWEGALADYTALLEQLAERGAVGGGEGVGSSGSRAAVRAYNSRAFCLASMGRLEEAVADWDAVLAIDPANLHALHNRWVQIDRGCGGSTGGRAGHVVWVCCWLASRLAHMPQAAAAAPLSQVLLPDGTAQPLMPSCSLPPLPQGHLPGQAEPAPPGSGGLHSCDQAAARQRHRLLQPGRCPGQPGALRQRGGRLPAGARQRPLGEGSAP